MPTVYTSPMGSRYDLSILKLTREAYDIVNTIAPLSRIYVMTACSHTVLGHELLFSVITL